MQQRLSKTEATELQATEGDGHQALSAKFEHQQSIGWPSSIADLKRPVCE